MNRRIGEVKILLVDKHQMLRQGLRRLIATKPELTVVGEAFDSESARDEIRTSAPHLVLMGIHPPGEKGVEGVRQMLAEFPVVKIIVLSGSSELELVHEALQAGVSGFFARQHDFQELFRAIHLVRDSHLYLSPEVSSAMTKEFMKTFIGGKNGRAGVVLSDRERWLLRFVAEGKRNKEIAAEMEVSAKSVETYRLRLKKKLRCSSAAALVRHAIRAGIVKA